MELINVYLEVFATKVKLDLPKENSVQNILLES